MEETTISLNHNPLGKDLPFPQRTPVHITPNRPKLDPCPHPSSLLSFSKIPRRCRSKPVNQTVRQTQARNKRLSFGLSMPFSLFFSFLFSFFFPPSSIFLSKLGKKGPCVLKCQGQVHDSGRADLAGRNILKTRETYHLVET